MKLTDRKNRAQELLELMEAARDDIAQEYLSACIDEERAIPPEDFLPFDDELLDEAFEAAEKYAYWVESGRAYDWVDASNYL